MGITAKITSAVGKIGRRPELRVNYEVSGYEEGDTIKNVELYTNGFNNRIMSRGSNRGWTGYFEPYSINSSYAQAGFALVIEYVREGVTKTERIQTDTPASFTLDDEVKTVELQFNGIYIKDVRDNPELCDIVIEHLNAKDGYMLPPITKSVVEFAYTLDGGDPITTEYSSDSDYENISNFWIKNVNRKDVAGKKFEIISVKAKDPVFPEFTLTIKPGTYNKHNTIKSIKYDLLKAEKIELQNFDITYLNSTDRSDLPENYYTPHIENKYYVTFTPPLKEDEYASVDNQIYLVAAESGKDPDKHGTSYGHIIDDPYFYSTIERPAIFRFSFSSNDVEDNDTNSMDLHWMYQYRDDEGWKTKFIPYKKDLNIYKAEYKITEKPLATLEPLKAKPFGTPFSVTMNINQEETTPDIILFSSDSVIYGGADDTVIVEQDHTKTVWANEETNPFKEIENYGDISIGALGLSGWTPGKIYINSNVVIPNDYYAQFPRYKEPFELKVEIEGEIATGNTIIFNIYDPINDYDSNTVGMEERPGPIAKVYKDGVLLKEFKDNYNEVVSYEIEDLTIANNGTYHIETEYFHEPIDGIEPEPVYTLRSEDIVINVEPLVDIKISLSQEGEFVIGSPVTLKCDITSDPNTIQGIDWFKNGELLKHVGTELSTTTEISEATKEDIGIYTVVVRYMENKDEVQKTSNAIILAESDTPEIDANIAITGPTEVNEGQSFTLKSDIKIKDEPEGLIKKYKWHHGKEMGGIPGETGPNLTIPKAEYLKHKGEYWLGVSIQGEGYKPLVKSSNKLSVKVLRDPGLTLKASANKLEVPSGSEIELSFKHSSKEGIEFDFEFEWYANNELIPDSKGKNPFKTIVDNDTAYYVKATPSSRVITDPVKSNVVIVKAMSEEDKPFLTINGPTEVKDNTSVNLEGLLLPEENVPLYKFEWYFNSNKVASTKNYTFIASKDKEGTYTLKAININNPDIFVEATHSITIKETELEVPVIVIDVVKSIKLKVGDTLNIKPLVVVIPEEAELQYSWTFNSEEVSSTKDFTKSEIKLSDSGTYILKVTAQGIGLETTSNTAEIKVSVTEESIDPPSSNGVRYIHDLNPARNKGYIWLGWWVHDEINEALVEGFDWINDPENERFKYKIDLKTLAYGFEHWDDLEIQESRHGYILSKRDLTV